MRIIAGEFRGRKLLEPEFDTTRPITDRVKQSLFDILTPLIPNAVVYDCFAGTGSMGLESLSRGARKAIHFERDRKALAGLRKNIDALGVKARSRVIDQDIFAWFRGLPQRPALDERATIVFLDPPYVFLRERADDLRGLGLQLAASHLSESGIVVFRHDARDNLDLPELSRYDQREYGGMTLDFLRRDTAPSGEDQAAPDCWPVVSR